MKVLLLLLVVVFEVTSGKLFEFSLRREKTLFEKLIESDVHPSLIHKLSTYIRESNPNASVPLFRYEDNEFYGTILLGLRGQKFNVIFDTTWGDSWVPSALCEAQNEFCKRHPKYDSSKSSTYKPDGRTIQIDYGKDYLKGILSNELLHVGQKNVTSQTFAEMTHIPDDFLPMHADGIFGLGFPSLSHMNVTPFLYNMFQQGTLSNKVFSVYFNRDPKSKKGGTLFLGGSEKKHYTGDFTYVNLIVTDYWRFMITSIHVKGNATDTCGKSGCPAIIDTSSSSISAPPAIAESINRQIRAKPYAGKYIVDCAIRKTLPAITFRIGDRDFILKSRDYIKMVQTETYSTCYSVFEANSFPPSFANYWTLGASFMARFYVEFDADKNRIGFADVTM